jgi:hypothetical protein
LQLYLPLIVLAREQPWCWPLFLLSPSA